MLLGYRHVTLEVSQPGCTISHYRETSFFPFIGAMTDSFACIFSLSPPVSPPHSLHSANSSWFDKCRRCSKYLGIYASNVRSLTTSTASTVDDLAPRHIASTHPTVRLHAKQLRLRPFEELTGYQQVTDDGNVIRGTSAMHLSALVFFYIRHSLVFCDGQIPNQMSKSNSKKYL